MFKSECSFIFSLKTVATFTVHMYLNRSRVFRRPPAHKAKIISSYIMYMYVANIKSLPSVIYHERQFDFFLHNNHTPMMHQWNRIVKHNYIRVNIYFNISHKKVLLWVYLLPSLIVWWRIVNRTQYKNVRWFFGLKFKVDRHPWTLGFTFSRIKDKINK